MQGMRQTRSAHCTRSFVHPILWERMGCAKEPRNRAQCP